MKKFALMTASVLAIGAAGAAIAHDDDDVEKISKMLDLTGFERIDVSGVYDLDIQVGKDFSIELSGPDYEMNRVEASVEDGVLYLDQREAKRGEKKNWRNKRHGIDAKIILPSLTGIEVSGVVDGEVKNIDAESFELEISGVGDLELDGECGTFEAEVSGVGDLDAEALECRVVNVQVSGVGDASVFARDEVDAQVSGMGDIEVYGSPKKVSKSDSMFASVTVH